MSVLRILIINSFNFNSSNEFEGLFSDLKNGYIELKNPSKIGSWIILFMLKSLNLAWIDSTLDVHHGGAVLLKGYIYGSNWNEGYI